MYLNFDAKQFEKYSLSYAASQIWTSLATHFLQAVQPVVTKKMTKKWQNIP